jgi:hypothetical protein
MLRRECGPIRGNPDRAAELGWGNRAAGMSGGTGVPRSVPNTPKLAWVSCRAPLPVRLLKGYVGIIGERGPSSEKKNRLRELLRHALDGKGAEFPVLT